METEEPMSLDLTSFELELLIGLCINLFSAKAWQYMGVRLTPGKEEAEKDLVKAATAIDIVTVMVNTVAPYIDEDEIGRLRSMISDLQLNYARQV